MSGSMMIVWPSVPIPWTPRVRGYDDARLTRGWPLIELQPSGVTVRPLPEDFYLWELMDLDLGSAEELLEFVRRWGPGAPVLLKERPPWKWDDDRAGGSGATEARPDAEAVYSWIREHDYVPNDAAVNVDECRLSLAALRDLVRVCLADAEVLTFDATTAAWECTPSPPPDAASATCWAARALSLGMREFHPRAIASCAEVRPAGDSDGSAAAGRDVNDAVLDVVSASCLLLFNHLASASSYRVCDRCGRAFVNQRGRSAGRRHRPTAEVRYCSARCASAATSESYRRRRRLGDKPSDTQERRGSM